MNPIKKPAKPAAMPPALRRSASGWLVPMLLAAAAAAKGQTLRPIYEKTPVERAAVATVAEFPAGTFLENVAIGARGEVVVNSHLDGKIYRIDAAGGPPILWSSVDGTIAGIALNPDGSALISGWVKGKQAAIFRVTAEGRSEILTLLDGGQFPNGMVRLGSDRYLVADSYRGAIWFVDAATKRARVWVENENLARADTSNPTPGVNGLKVFGHALYASNTAKQLLLRIPLVGDDGQQPGRVEVLRTQLGLDDFAFDADGTLYGSTHVYDSLVRVAPDGRVTVIADRSQGMAGSTAVAASTPSGGPLRLYVVTNGGLSLPPPGGVQPARVLRVDPGTKQGG